MADARTNPVEFAVQAARLLDDRHCTDVRLLDVRGLSQVCDFVLVGTGTSDRQMKSVAAELEDLGEEHNSKVFRSSRDDGGTWIVVDFVDLVTHLFEPSQRSYYDIESLWNDAKSIRWQRGNGVADAAKTKPASGTRTRK